MSLLQTLGTALNAGLGVVSVLTPTLGPILTTVGALAPGTKPVVQSINNELPEIAQTVAQIEAVGIQLSLDGNAKLRLAAPFVTQVIMKSPLMADKKIQDKALFDKGVADITSGMVALLNSLDHQAGATQDSKS